MQGQQVEKDRTKEAATGRRAESPVGTKGVRIADAWGSANSVVGPPKEPNIEAKSHQATRRQTVDQDRESKRERSYTV